MKTRLIIALFTLCLALIAHARIGDTEDAIAKRYGNPTDTDTTDPDSTLRVYVVKEFKIHVCFNKTTKRSEMEMMTKIDGSEFTDNEINLIMKANGGDKTWNLVKDFDFVNKKWWLSDGSICVMYGTLDHTLNFISKEGLQAIGKKKQADERKKLEGF